MEEFHVPIEIPVFKNMITNKKDKAKNYAVKFHIFSKLIGGLPGFEFESPEFQNLLGMSSGVGGGSPGFLPDKNLE